MLITGDYVRKLLPVYNQEQHKYDRGKILILGGSKGMTGAPSLSAYAALRTGCGMVIAGIPESLNGIMEVKLTEAMTLPLYEDEGHFAPDAYKKALEFAEGCDCVAVGMGGGRNRGLKKIVTEFLRDYDKTMLIDADGINVLAEMVYRLEKTKAKVILTPHIGEFSRLTGLTKEEILDDRKNIAKSFAEKYNAVLVLKGKNTIVTDGDRIYENTTGNEGMATGGSGDVLSGMISAFAAQGLETFDSAVAGVYLHGLAGDIAKEKNTVYSVIASDIIDNIPCAFKRLTEEIK